MKELHMDRFDALLSLASAECMKEEADAFLSADVSEIADNPKMLKKILGLSRKNKWKPVKIIVLVALLCMFIAFTACMLVPEIRNAVWNVFVKGHDDHVEVGFGSGEVSEEVAEVPVMNYPSTIEDKMVVTYVPEGWIKGEETGLSSQYKVSYYTTEGEWCFNIYQSAISEVNSYVNDNTGFISHLEVRGEKAVLVENYEDKSKKSLVWQDERYRYTICGYFDSYDELIKIAEGIK